MRPCSRILGHEKDARRGLGNSIACGGSIRRPNYGSVSDRRIRSDLGQWRVRIRRCRDYAPGNRRRLSKRLERVRDGCGSLRNGLLESRFGVQSTQARRRWPISENPARDRRPEPFAPALAVARRLQVGRFRSRPPTETSSSSPWNCPSAIRRRCLRVESKSPGSQQALQFWPVRSRRTFRPAIH